MEGMQTTAVVQRYLDELRCHSAEESAAPVVHELLESSVRRLQFLCASMLRRSYPRLMRPPYGLEVEELLSAVVVRLMQALREVRPGNVRQFFSIASMHMRWELNDLIRRLDAQGPLVALHEEGLAAPEESAPRGDGARAQRVLAAIENLPPDEHEVFNLVRIQGLPHTEVALLLGVSTKTIQRRLNRSLLALTAELQDLRAARGDEASA